MSKHKHRKEMAFFKVEKDDLAKGSEFRCPKMKRRFTNEKEANRAINKQRKWGSKVCRSYLCPECKGYHLTSASRVTDIPASGSKNSGKRMGTKYNRSKEGFNSIKSRGRVEDWLGDEFD